MRTCMMHSPHKYQVFPPSERTEIHNIPNMLILVFCKDRELFSPGGNVFVFHLKILTKLDVVRVRNDLIPPQSADSESILILRKLK